MHATIIIVGLAVAMVCMGTDGSLYYEKVNKTADGQCNITRHNLIVDIDVMSHVPNECQDLICDSEYTVTYFGCPPLPDAPCKTMVGNPKDSYPDCCDSKDLNECQ